MPRFHFHVHDGRDWPDEEGVELASVAQARIEALRHAGDMLKDSAIEAQHARGWRMQVTDGQGQTVLYLEFRLTETPEATSSG